MKAILVIIASVFIVGCCTFNDNPKNRGFDKQDKFEDYVPWWATNNVSTNVVYYAGNWR